MFAMRDVQNGNGRFADIAPVDFGFGGLLWGSAGITVAWESYQQFGDVGLLEEHYGAMKKHMDFLDTRIDKNTGLMTEGFLGDWLSPEGNKNDNSLLFAAYYIFDLEIMARTADVLGRKDDAAEFWKKHEERMAHFNQTYIDPETYKTVRSSYRPPFGPGAGGSASSEDSGKVKFMDTQVSYAVPLALGAFNEANASFAARNLAQAVERQSVDDGGATHPAYSLMTGFIGTAWISKALSDHGYSEVAYRLLQQETYPSWLYPVSQGATTIWERLNSYTYENGFGGNNSMNSFNHYSFGAVGQWMMAYSLGIQRDEPGFRKFILQPEPDPTGQMTWAEGHYDSMYGRINSFWKVDNGKLTYAATVPANTTATLYIPASSQNAVTEGGEPVARAKGVTFVKYAGGKAVYELESGRYEFETQLWN
jgi:alpha-L-rhamnosidase